MLRQRFGLGSLFAIILVSGCGRESMPAPADESRVGDGTTSIFSLSGVPGDYGIGDTVPMTMELSRNVTVTGTPRLMLNLVSESDEVVAAQFDPSSSGSLLKFNYQVSEGDHNAVDLSNLYLTYAAENALQLSDGSILDADGNAMELSLGEAPSRLSDIRIDAIRPYVLEAKLQSGQSNLFTHSGIPVYFDVVFSELVDVHNDSGTRPILALDGDRQAHYFAGENTDTLTFVYTTTETDSIGQLDLDSTESESIIGGNVYDLDFYNELQRTISSEANKLPSENIVIETVHPAISSISSEQSCAILCGAGDSLTLTITFSRSVTLSPGATLTLSLSSGRSLTSSPGPATFTTLDFSYLIEEGESSGDENLIVNHIEISDGGTLSNAAAPDNYAILDLPNAIDGAPRIDSIEPTVISVASVPSNGSYGMGQIIPIAIVFSEAVTVTGIPNLTLSITRNDESIFSTATYASGSNTSILTFHYTVQSGDVSPLSTASTNALTGGTLQDLAGNSADRSLPTPADLNVHIEGRALSVTSLSTTLAAGTYGSLQGAIPITLHFNRGVNSDGSATLTLSTSPLRTLTIPSSASYSSILSLSYTVGSTDNSILISNANSIGGNLRDAYGNALSSADIGNWNHAIVIDGVAPYVDSVTSSISSGTLEVDSIIPIDVTFSEPIRSTHSVSLTLRVGLHNRVLIADDGGSATSVLHFVYTVTAADGGAVSLAPSALSLPSDESLGDVVPSGLSFLNNAVLTLRNNLVPDLFIDPLIPKPPSNLTVYTIAAQSDWTNYLSWTPSASADIVNYVIWRSTSPDDFADNAPPSTPPLTTAFTVSSDTSHYDDLSPEIKTTYHYKIWAHNEGGYYSQIATSPKISSKHRDWTFNAYLKADAYKSNYDNFGGSAGLDPIASFTGGRGVDLASWTNSAVAKTYAVVGAANYQCENSSDAIPYNNDDVDYDCINTNPSISSVGAAWVYKRSLEGDTWEHDAYLRPTQCNYSEENFGFSVAMSPTLKMIAVGAPQDRNPTLDGIYTTQPSCDATNTPTGGVYLFGQGSDLNWFEAAYLKKEFAGSDNALFGWSVALSDERIVVGAPGRDVGETIDAGGAVVYQIGATDPPSISPSSAYALLERVHSGAYENFGFSAAVDSTTVVVGAPWEGGDCASGINDCANRDLDHAGAVYVYETEDISGQGGSLYPSYYLTSRNYYDRFGVSVAISGDTIVVGAPGDYSMVTTIVLGTGSSGGRDDGNHDCGSVYVFRRSGSTWVQEAILHEPFYAQSDLFGMSVDISGDMISVGTRGDDRAYWTITSGTADIGLEALTAAPNSGAAYVYRRTGTSWFRDAFLNPGFYAGEGTTDSYDNQNMHIAFGATIAIDPISEAVIVAAPGDKATNGSMFTIAPKSYNLDMGTADGIVRESGAVYIFAP